MAIVTILSHGENGLVFSTEGTKAIKPFEPKIS
jgi:hypothetical protein